MTKDPGAGFDAADATEFTKLLLRHALRNRFITAIRMPARGHTAECHCRTTGYSHLVLGFAPTFAGDEYWACNYTTTWLIYIL